MQHLAGNMPYIFMVLCLSMLSYVIAAVQFWMSDYFMEALHADPRTAFTGFAIICITGPALGSIIAGYAISAFGGYNSIKTYFFALGGCIVLCMSVAPIPVLSDVIAVLVFLFFALTCGGMI